MNGLAQLSWIENARLHFKLNFVFSEIVTKVYSSVIKLRGNGSSNYVPRLEKFAV